MKFTWITIVFYLSCDFIAFSQIDLKYAQKFTLEQDEHGWVMTVKEPYKGSREIIKTRIAKRGTKPPEQGMPIIYTPVRSVISLSTVNLPHLSALNEVASIVGVDSFQYINTEAVLKRVEADQIREVGEFQNLNVEKVMELRPDLVLTYTTGQAKYDTHHRLRKAGVQTLVLASYLEGSPLGRAEWIKLFGLLYDKVEEANEIFEGIDQRYLAMKKLTAKVKDRPSVLCNAPFGNTWYVPGGKSYRAELLADAGADYLWKDNTESGALPLAFEKVFEVAHRADIWLVSSHLPWRNYEDVLKSDPRYEHFQAYKNKKMVSNDKRSNPKGGNDIYEKGTLYPDLVLKDLIQIFHPQLLEQTPLTFYRPLNP